MRKMSGLRFGHFLFFASSFEFTTISNSERYPYQAFLSIVIVMLFLDEYSSLSLDHFAWYSKSESSNFLSSSSISVFLNTCSHSSLDTQFELDAVLFIANFITSIESQFK